MDSIPHKGTRGSASSQEAVCLTIPCRAGYVGLCRLLAGVVGARESLDAEDIADLKLVVTEACNCFLGAAEGNLFAERSECADPPPDRLLIEYMVTPGRWVITVSDPEGRYRIPEESRCDPSGAGGLGLTIIQALADTIEHTHSDPGGSRIRLTKNLASGPADDS